MATRRLHQALSGRRLTRLEYEHALPPLQDALLEAQFKLREAGKASVILIVTGIPAAGRSEVTNELLGWLDPKFATVYGFGAPNDVELQRPQLWRYWRLMPPKGTHSHPARRLVPGPAARCSRSRFTQCGHAGAAATGRRARRAAGTDAGARRRQDLQSPPARCARDAAEANRQAAVGQDHALARDGRGSLAGAQLPFRRARVRTHAGCDRAAAGAVACRRRHGSPAPGPHGRSHAAGGDPASGFAAAGREDGG